MWPNKRAPESKISMADRFKMTYFKTFCYGNQIKQQINHCSSTNVKPGWKHRIHHTQSLNRLGFNVALNKDWSLVKVLRPTQHKIGHFRDVLPSQSLSIVLKKLNLTQQKHTL